MRDSAGCCASIRAPRCQLPPDSELKSTGRGTQQLPVDRPDEFVCPTGMTSFSNRTGKQDSIVPSGTVTYNVFTNGTCTNPAASSSVQTVSVTGTVPNSSTQSNLA